MIARTLLAARRINNNLLTVTQYLNKNVRFTATVPKLSVHCDKLRETIITKEMVYS